MDSNYHVYTIFKVSASGSNPPSSSSRKVSILPTNEESPTYKEVFVAPQLSLVACLMKKPSQPPERILYDYDSSASDVVRSVS